VRRGHLYFAVAVVAAFASAFAAERRRRQDAPVRGFEAPSTARLPPLAVGRGMHRVRGRVLDARGAAFAGATVRLRLEGQAPAGAERLFFGSTDDAGAFELERLPAGSYEVLLLAPGVPPAISSWSVPDDRDLELALAEPYPELPAAPDVVRTELLGAIVPPPGLGPADELGGYEVLLRPDGDEARWHGAVERRTASEPDGRFRFAELARADYQLFVLPPWAAGGSWPALATLSVEAERLGAAEGAEPLRVELAVGELEGRLLDPGGLAIGGALLTVRAVGDPPERTWPATSTDGAGGFFLRDLAAPPEGRLYVLRVHAGAGRREIQVEVRPGERQEVSFGLLDTRPPATEGSDAR
jgi:hypothetical protein